MKKSATMKSPAKEEGRTDTKAVSELEACKRELKFLKEEIIGKYMQPF